MKVIVYKQDNGLVAICFPSGDIPINEVARKDVPAGKAYKIIENSDLPSDGIFHEAWEIDMTNPDGYGIGSDAWFAEQAAKEAA